MKVTISVFALLTLLTFKSFSQSEKAYIHVYRPGQFTASMSNFSIYLNDSSVCKLSNKKRIFFEVDPGQLELESIESGAMSGLKKTSITLNAIAGDTIYIKGDVKSSFTRYRMELTRVFKESFIKDVEKQNIEIDNCQLE